MSASPSPSVARNQRKYKTVYKAMNRSPFSEKITERWLRWIYVLCYFRINQIRPKATTNTEIYIITNLAIVANHCCESCDMFDDKRLYVVSVVSH